MVGHATVVAGLPGHWEIWVILLIILLLFGRRIPQVARSLGQGISQFKRGLHEPDLDLDEPPSDASSSSKSESKSESKGETT